MSNKKKDSHKKFIEERFGVNQVQKNSEDPFELEEEEEFGTRFKIDKKTRKNDKQYDSLIKDIPNKKQLPFEITEKYYGKKVKKEELFKDFSYENDENINSDLENLEENREENHENLLEKPENLPAKTANLQAKQKKSKKIQGKPKKIAMDNKNLDTYLREIDEEDINEEQNNAKNEKESLQKSKTVHYQLKLWKALLSLRMQFQPILELLKKAPKSPLEKPSKNLQNQILITFLLENLSKMQGDLLKSSSFNREIQPIPPIFQSISSEISGFDEDSNDFSVDPEAIYQEFDGFYQSYFPWAELSLTKWSEKTNILSSNLSKTGLKNLLHTPIGQVNKMMENFEKLKVKSQLKRGHFRILGEGLENLEKNFDENIYDDSDLMQEMLKNFLEPGGNENFIEDMPLYDTTRQYLLERKLKNEEKTHKNVDRRASKNRKLRYEIHAKLVNFMQCEDRYGVIEGRDEILKSIKRRFEGDVDENGNGEIKEKKVKRENKYEPKLI